MPKKVLLFIVTYNAELTIQKVLKRVPDHVFESNDYELEILVIDDCSDDRTFELGETYRRHHLEVPLTVFSNPQNLGYGGNQKLGYRYAIDQGFDIVALLHGDAQYPPEKLLFLLEPLLRGEADAVFGSRMFPSEKPLRGGMPLYKYVGNKVLTFLQNRIVGTRLHEYHSGYRIYSVQVLSRIPFEYNSDDFDFDTDIIIQLHESGCRIKELPIPTFYGDEICHVTGIVYAIQVLRSCLMNWVQRFGVFYDPRYDVVDSSDVYEPKFHFCSSHSLALEAVSERQHCFMLSTGPPPVVAPFFDKGCSLTAVDHVVSEQVKPYFTAVYTENIEDFDFERKIGVQKFDCILALDILEHLSSPETLLAEMRKHSSFEDATLIITTPNVAFFVTRLMLLLGSFNYGKLGILDRTHRRLFTFSSFCVLLRNEGYRIEKLQGIPAPFPLALGNNAFSRFLLALNRVGISLWRSMFSYQIYCEAKPSPTSSLLLERAKKQAESKAARMEKNGENASSEALHY